MSAKCKWAQVAKDCGAGVSSIKPQHDEKKCYLLLLFMFTEISH